MRAVLQNRHFWLFAAAYAVSLGVLAATGRSIEEAIAALIILGAGLPLVALATCWRLPDPTAPQPWRGNDASTMTILVGWIAVFLAVKGPLQDALLPAGAWPALRETANIAFKLLVFVAVPAAFLHLRGFEWRQAGRATAPAGRLWLSFVTLSIAYVAMQYLLGSEFQRLLQGDYPARHIVLGSVLCFAWVTLEAGVVEEFFFRWYLQTRLAAWSGSQVSGIFLGALVFGLAHAPGIWLRGGGAVEGLGSDPSLATTIAYVVTTQGVAGLLFGVLWARTRSFTLVVLLHGLADALSNTASFMDTWGL